MLLYFIWGKTKNSYEWMEFDVSSTIDSIKVAIEWLNQQAAKNDIDLKIRIDINQDTTGGLYQRMGGEVENLISERNGIEKVNKWTNRIARMASGYKTKERLIAHLRNEHQLESVGLIFLLNNYFERDFAFSFNTTSDADVEYSIISTKNPVVFAQEILNLFGAPYLYSHPSVRNKRDTRQLQKIFPNDIMGNPTLNIHELNIGEVTKYYIGWTDELNEEYERMVKEKAKI